MYLHIFGSPKRGFQLIYTSTPELANEIKFEWYATKAQAKQAAKEAKAACSSIIFWNF